jgi:hypothetical protein
MVSFYRREDFSPSARSKSIDHSFAEFEALGGCTKLNDFGNLAARVTVTIKQLKVVRKGHVRD